MDATVEVDCLCKTYRGGESGVTCVTFQAVAGEVLGLLGPTRAGKTTILTLIAGQLKPTAGCVRIAGRDCAREPAIARQKVDALLRPVAAQHRPWQKPVLLVDEPALSLARPHWQQLAATLQALAHDGGRTVIVATRSVDVARRLCDRVAILKDGRLLECCPVDRLRGDPDGRSWYEIRVKGHLGGQWSDWFAGFSLTSERGGRLLLSGPVADQAALHGLLDRIRDLGLPLISVTSSEPLNLAELGRNT